VNVEGFFAMFQKRTDNNPISRCEQPIGK
jgi:hypothetical protein